MEIVRDTPFEVGLQVWQARPPVDSLTIVVKATYELVPGSACRIAGEQTPVTGDLFHDDDPEGSLRYASDLAWLKPRAECFLVGEFRSPGAPITAAQVGFRVGSVAKELVLLGDRRHSGGLFGGITDPTPFTAMPLCWERSFGGPDVAENPVGRGIEAIEIDGAARVPLPNIEDRVRLVTGKRDRPKPAGAFPIHPGWRSRGSHLGTYDKAWQKTRFPWLPADFAWEYFCAAPEDQRFPGFLVGNEKIELSNLLPGTPFASSALPGLRARCFLEEGPGASFREVQLALDTVTVEVPSGKVFALFRGVVELAKEAPDAPTRLFVMHEPIADASSIAQCRERLLGRLDGNAREELEFEVVPAPGDDDSPLPRSTDAGASIRAELVATMHAGKSLAGFQGSEADLSGLDLRGKDLTGAILRGAILRGTDLTDAKLDDAVLVEADLEGAVVTGASFRGADLSGAHGPRLSFIGAALDGTIALDADLRGARFERCSAVSAELSGVDLTGAELLDCAFDRADLARCKLGGARLVGCSFVDASMEEASAQSAFFEGCDLSKLRAADGADFTQSMLRGAKLRGARFGQARLSGANLSFADLAGADFSDAVLVEALLLGCDLRGARFDRARLHGAQLTRSDLLGARFEEAQLVRADLRGANLYGAELFRANTEGALLELANVEGTKLA